MTSTNYRVLEPQSKDLLYARKYVWEFPLRLSHWLNAAAITALFVSGLYIGSPIFSLQGEAWQNFLMGQVRRIHFIAGYVLLFGFLLRIYWFYAGNNYARSGFPMVWRRSWWVDIRDQALHYLQPGRGHVHLGHNALAGLSYTIFVLGVGWAMIFSGLALYSESNPTGFWGKLTGWIIPLFGGSYPLRMWHHTLAWGFAVFVILHLYIVFYDDRLYKNGLVSSMVAGFKFYERKDLDHDRWIS